MDKKSDNKTTDEELYPSPTKGSFSDDYTSYGALRKWAGGDPDKHLTKYFIGFLVVIVFLFIVVVKLLSGSEFFF